MRRSKTKKPVNFKGNNKLTRLETYKIDRKRKNICEMCILDPNSRFKMIWDLIVILFSVYNSILIPYEFAYSLTSNIMLDLLDRLIDIVFAIDIIINFRTAYTNSKTGKLESDGKKIALKYVMNGRFGVDIIASLPLEAISLINLGGEGSLKFLGMLKLVRLLRLGRMISFLKSHQKLQFSIKIGQLLFFVFLTIHWLS
jgi:hypothetical protein